MMNCGRRRRFLGTLLAIGILCRWNGDAVCFSDDGSMPAIKSLLAAKCVACHSGDAPKGKLDLASRESILRGGESGPGIVAQSPARSPLWHRVNQNEMPPKQPLNESEKTLLKTWIAAGAEWTGGPLDPSAVTSEHRAGLDWWSLQPIAAVQIPTIKLQVNARQPVDDFVIEKLSVAGLSPSPEADRHSLIRRVSFDLLGLPPSPDVIEEFVRDDRPDAYERLIDRLLASPHYGERWTRHWLDVVRFGESHGFERDLPRPNAWHYRDWVIQAFNRDMPYDQFVRWQIAGDVIAPQDLDAVKAVGFLVAGAHDTVVPVFDSMRAAMRQDELEDIIGTVGQSFLGLTVNCARCHDHKFDPISTREYYRLASALSGVDHGEREIVPDVVTRELKSLQDRITELTRQVQDQAAPIRDTILAKRALTKDQPTATDRFPQPIADWNFTRDLEDHAGQLPVTLVGNARRTENGLELDGAAYGKTPALPFSLREKTLEVRLRLKTRQQSGGGAFTVQTLDGQTFDSLVYAELEPGRWMAGSDLHQRSLSFEGPVEQTADHENVTMTLVYRADGTILAYRNGEPYGHPVRKSDAVTFESHTSYVVFGVRHGSDAGGNRALKGTVAMARLFNTALSPEQVRLSAGVTNTEVAETEILERLSIEQRTAYLAAQSELKSTTTRHADLLKNGPVHIYTAVATQPSPMKIHQRGSVLSLGDMVTPGGIAAIHGLSSEFGLRADSIESYRRERLANWITDPQNALFLRTIVNRVWHYHFEAGLVESPNDLGFHGGKPSHPELLEWLASEFKSYSMKRLHRLIVTSATYRQAATFNSAAAKLDTNNRLLWRKTPRRLEAEEIRDAMLSAAGQLNTQIGGQGYRDVNSYFFKGTQFYDPIDPVGYQNQRRTVYRMWARSGRSPFLDTFDCPDPSTTTPRRSSTVTPLQALSLLNHSFSIRMADRFAERLSAESMSADANGGVTAEVRQAYRLLFSREPSAEELGLCRDFIARRGLPEFCRAMWNTSEFLFVD